MADINQVQLPDGSQYNITDTHSGYATMGYVQDQISAIDASTIGLGNVDNTSDMDKPVSTAQQTAIDAKANNSTIAYTESSATATKRYEIGEQFILNGTLYTATAIIPNGGAITVGTNCTASDALILQIDTVKSGLTTAQSDISTLSTNKANKSDLASISITGTTNNTGATIVVGTYFYLNGTLCKAKTSIANGATLTLNTNYVEVNGGSLNNFAILTEPLISTFNITAGGQVDLLFNNTAPSEYTFLGVVGWNIYVGTSGVASIYRQDLLGDGTKIVIGIASTVARTNASFSGTAIFIKNN